MIWTIKVPSAVALTGMVHVIPSALGLVTVPTVPVPVPLRVISAEVNEEGLMLSLKTALK